MGSSWAINKKIEKIYHERKLANPRYSVRAFALSLGLNNSTMSKIIRSKRPVGKQMAQKIEKKLGVILWEAKDEKKTKKIKYQDVDFEKNTFAFPWYFLALIEYLKIDPRLKGMSFISAQLKTSPSKIEETLYELEKIKMIEKKGASWKINVQFANTYLNPIISTAKAREHQKKILIESALAVDQIDIKERLHSGLYFRFDATKMEEIRECVSEFRRELTKLALKYDESADQVMLAHVGVFKILSAKDS